jgi:hypothetical protein
LTEEFFLALLSGVCRLLGADFSLLQKLFGAEGGKSALFVSLAVWLGASNALFLLLWRFRTQLEKRALLSLSLPPLLFLLLAGQVSFLGENSSRSSAWLLLASAAICYLLNQAEDGIFKGRSLYGSLIAVSFFLPLSGFGASLVLFFILLKSNYRRSARFLIFAGQLPWLLGKCLLAMPPLEREGFELSFLYLASVAGVLLAWKGLEKLQRMGRCKGAIQLLTLLACVALYITSRQGAAGADLQLYQSRFPSMGTACEISLWHGDAAEAEVLLKNSYRIFEEIENTLSTYKAESELSRLNRSAHERAFACGPVLWENLMLAEEGWQLSGGAFDVTVGPLVKLWKIKRKRSTLPTQEEIAAARSLVGFDLLEIDREKRSVKFKKEGLPKVGPLIRCVTTCTLKGYSVALST